MDNKQPVQWWWNSPEEAKQAVSWIEDRHLQLWHGKRQFYMLSYAGLVEADRRYWEEQGEKVTVNK